MMNPATMDLAMMNFDVAPGAMIGVMGPLLGVVGAIATAVLAYGFAAIAYAALHGGDRPRSRSRVKTLEPVRHGA